MRRRFFWSLVAVAVATITVGGIAAAILIHRSVEDSIRTEFARQASATARIVEAQFLEDAVQGGRGEGQGPGVSGLGEVLVLVSAVGGHDYVEAALVNRQGELVDLAETDRVLLPLVPEDVDLTRPYRFDAEVEGTQVTAIVQPFRVERRGTLVIAIGTELEIIPWGDVLLRFAWAIGLGILLAAALAGGLARRLSRRVEPLQDASRDIADGDLGVRLSVDANDEFAEVEQAFNAMAVQLEAARTREREFLVSVGHDLRTPLTTIAGYAEAIEDGRIEDHDIERVAAVLGTETSRLRRLVEDLMLLSRLEAREFTLRIEPVDLTAHLKGIAEGFRGRAESARVELRTDLEPTGDVEIDPDRIAQVVANLLENALRYTPEAGAVTLGVSRASDGVAVTVSDTGPGIDPSDLPHIFERLYVTARYRPVRPEGSGLGLSIVRELVDAMEGSVSVSSEVGEGTAIRVDLPI